MPKTISPHHQEAKDDLVHGLRIFVKHNGGIGKCAVRMGMDDHNLAKILRLDRAVSLSKLEEMGNAVGLKLEMKWVQK